MSSFGGVERTNTGDLARFSEATAVTPFTRIWPATFSTASPAVPVAPHWILSPRWRALVVRGSAEAADHSVLGDSGDSVNLDTESEETGYGKKSCTPELPVDSHRFRPSLSG